MDNQRNLLTWKMPKLLIPISFGVLLWSLCVHIFSYFSPSGVNGQVRYFMYGGNTGNAFSIDSVSGQIKVYNKLDAEQM